MPHDMKHAVWRPAVEPTLGCCCGVYAPMWSLIGPSFFWRAFIGGGGVAWCGTVWTCAALVLPRAALCYLLPYLVLPCWKC